MKLYELATQFENLRLAIDAADGEIDDAFEAHLQQLEGDLKSKVDGCLMVARTFELEAEALEKEEKRLHARRKSVERRRLQLRNYVRDNLVRVGVTSLRTQNFTVGVRDGKDSLVIDDADRVPTIFWVKVPTIDKSALKTYLVEKKLPVEGAHLERGERILTVR